MKSVALHNLGCKVNSYEIEVMQQMLQEKGYTIVPFDETADIYIVNTCTVTNIADRKSRQMLHRAKQKNPAALYAGIRLFGVWGIIKGPLGFVLIYETYHSLARMFDRQREQEQQE